MTNVTWTDDKRTYLLDMLIEQKQTKGKMTDTGNFKAETWKEILNQFNQKFRVNWELQSLKTEYGNTKTKYQIYESLMNLSGQPFEYNEDAGMVVGDEEQWNTVIAAAPNSKVSFHRQLKTKPYLYREKIELLLQGEIANGLGAVGLNQLKKQKSANLMYNS